MPLSILKAYMMSARQCLYASVDRLSAWRQHSWDSFLISGTIVFALLWICSVFCLPSVWLQWCDRAKRLGIVQVNIIHRYTVLKCLCSYIECFLKLKLWLLLLLIFLL